MKKKSKKNKLTWLLKVEEDTYGQYIVLPQGLLDQVGWKEGDSIIWDETKTGYTLTKAPEPKE